MKENLMRNPSGNRCKKECLLEWISLTERYYGADLCPFSIQFSHMSLEKSIFFPISSYSGLDNLIYIGVWNSVFVMMPGDSTQSITMSIQYQ